MSMTECGHCGKCADSRSMQCCEKCGAMICEECVKNGGECPPDEDYPARGAS